MDEEVKAEEPVTVDEVDIPADTSSEESSDTVDTASPSTEIHPDLLTHTDVSPFDWKPSYEREVPPIDQKLALTNARTLDLYDRTNDHAQQLSDLQKQQADLNAKIEAIQKSAAPSDTMSMDPNKAMAQGLGEERKAINANTQQVAAINSAQVGNIQATQQQNQDIYQQAYKEQQQYAQQIQAMGNQYPNTSYAAIEKNMSSTQTAMKYAAFALGAMSAGFNGGHNEGVTSYYNALDKNIQTNNQEYKKQIDRIHEEHGSSMEGLQLKLGASNDRMNMLTQSHSAMMSTVNNAMQNATTLAQQAKVASALWYTQKNYELALRTAKREDDKYQLDYYNSYAKAMSGANSVMIKDPLTGNATPRASKGTDHANSELAKLPVLEERIRKMKAIDDKLSGPVQKTKDKEGKETQEATVKKDSTGWSSGLTDEELQDVALQYLDLHPHMNSKDFESSGIDPRREFFTRGSKEGRRQDELAKANRLELTDALNQYNSIIQQNTYSKDQQAQQRALFSQLMRPNK